MYHQQQFGEQLDCGPTLTVWSGDHLRGRLADALNWRQGALLLFAVATLMSGCSDNGRMTTSQGPWQR